MNYELQLCAKTVNIHLEYIVLMPTDWRVVRVLLLCFFFGISV